MPEGDTIHRAAATLHRALAGKRVVAFESVLPALTRIHDDAPLTGRTIERVTAAGKHLLMHFSPLPGANGTAPAVVLRTHMRMNGSWHIYRSGERWKRPRRDMRLVVSTAAFDAVAFNVPVAEFLRDDELSRHADLGRLGPDLLGEEFDLAEARRRLRARSDLSIGDALLNQRLVAGIGNVYKSEVLFACGVNPFASVSSLEDATLDGLLITARHLLRANVTMRLAPMTTYSGYRRTTGRADPAERLWVYGRARRPCRRCATPVRVRKTGDDARLTYWCERCQRTGEVLNSARC